MKSCVSCFHLFVIYNMISSGLCGLITRTYCPLSALRSLSYVSLYPQTTATANFQSKRSYFSMKYDEIKPSKNNDSNPKSSRGPSAKRGPVRSTSTTSKGDQRGGQQSTLDSDGVRLNKCLHGLSRRGADDAISEGRVTVNNVIATNGVKVKKRDIVRLVSSLNFTEFLRSLLHQSKLVYCFTIFSKQYHVFPRGVESLERISFSLNFHQIYTVPYTHHVSS